MAKGVEDTAFYRYVRLLALNEVGGDPGRFGLSVEAFHRDERRARRPLPRDAAAGNDARHEAQRRRARAHRRARRHGRANGRERGRGAGTSSPTSCATAMRPTGPRSCFVYQTLAGAWPIGADRLEPYLEKALREAKRNTSWIEPERGLGGGGQALRAPGCSTHEAFLADFEPFAARDRRRRRAFVASASSCCGSPRPACPTSTTATSCRTSRSSIRTTAGRSTGTSRRAALGLARRSAGRVGQAARDPRGARAARAPARGLRRRRLRAAPRGRGHVRLPPRRRRRRRRSGARRRARDRPAARPLAQRPRRVSARLSAATACCCSNGGDEGTARSGGSCVRPLWV